MDKGYEVFCLSDALFYDSPLHARGDDVDLAVVDRPVPAGWTRSELDDWLVYMPPDIHLPKQGWKIHSSGTLDNAEEIVSIVWDYCVPRRMPFKFVPGPHLLHLRNTKYAARDTSGKFVTVYPADEEQLHNYRNVSFIDGNNGAAMGVRTVISTGSTNYGMVLNTR